MSFGPIVAGTFYTDDPRELSQQIDSMIASAEAPAEKRDVFGLISPHAGYVYSGPCAAHGYKLLEGRHYDTVVVIGLSHRVPGAVSVLDADSYRTPLGEIPIDRAQARELVAKLDFVDDNPDLFAFEHSIEVQLPFLQRTLHDFKVVLISMRTQSEHRCRLLADALDEVFDTGKTLFIASSDLSHFHTYSEAKSMDLATLDKVEHGDIDRLGQFCASGEGEMCGIAPVMTLMHLFKDRGGEDIRVLKYMNSGDTSGDRSRVVGYGSVAFFDRASNAAVEADDPETPTTQEAERRFHLTNADKRRLFEIARESISLWQNEQRRKDYPDESENLNAPAAAFVTLHRDGELRGCVGSVESDEPLWMNVREMAIAAATRDTRFEPLWPGELEACDLEISVMTPLTRVTSPDEIVPGEHGILLRRGYQRGLLLPQVAAKYGWDAREFLRQTCRKAGMEDDAWRDPATEIDVFSAVVFSEKDVQGVDADVH